LDFKRIIISRFGSITTFLPVLPTRSRLPARVGWHGFCQYEEREPGMAEKSVAPFERHARG